MDKKLQKQLKSQAHHLNPVVIVGQKGLTEAVISEIDSALDIHELLKVKLAAGERDQRKLMAQEICANTQAELVDLIGKVVTIYRENEDD